MKTLYLALSILVFTCFGCQNSESTDTPTDKTDEVATNADNNEITELDLSGLSDSEVELLLGYNVKLNSNLPADFSSKKLYQLTVFYYDFKDTFEINRKYYGKDYAKALTDYLDNLDLNEVKDGILYCYCDKATHPCEPECMDIVKKYCTKHDIDLFSETPVNLFDPANPSSNIWWIVKSSKYKTESEETTPDDQSDFKSHKFPFNFSRERLCKITVHFDSNKNVLEVNRETFEKDHEKAFEDYLNALDAETLKDGILFCYCIKAVEPRSTKYFSIVKAFCESKDIDLFDEIPVSETCKDSEHISWVVQSSKTKFKSE